MQLRACDIDLFHSIGAAQGRAGGLLERNIANMLEDIREDMAGAQVDFRKGMADEEAGIIAGGQEGMVGGQEGLTGGHAGAQAGGAGESSSSSARPERSYHEQSYPEDQGAAGLVGIVGLHEQIEQALAALFPPTFENGKTVFVDHFDDEKFQRISELLKLLGKDDWSLRPRTYAVLRMIRRVDVMGAFVVEGLYDISLPYSERTLPDSLNSAAARSKFLDLQSLVMTAKAADLENGTGGHTYFNSDASAHFERIKVLGSGGFGEVDHVWSRLSMNEYARKRIPRGRSFKKDKAAISNFEQELAILKRLSHRHLVKFIGSYTDPKYVSIIMSPVAESNLAEYLQANPFPQDRRPILRSFYGCLASALLYLHDNCLRHKDVKPANVLVHGNNVLLTDFGTALDWSEVGQSTTKSKPAALSVPYCAPEVANWEKRNSSSDIWSLGCVFVEMETVLKGETIDSMHQFFHNNGTHQRYIRNNAEATRVWLERLRSVSGQPMYDKPLQWIPEMLKVNPFERLNARQILHRIRAVDPATTFCGPCCGDDEEHDESSDEASNDGDEVQSPGQVETLQSQLSTQPIDSRIKDSSVQSTENSDGYTVISTPSRGWTSELGGNDQSVLAATQSSLEEMSIAPVEPAGYTAQEEEAIQHLLDQGVDVEAPDFDATSALRSAIFNEYEVAVRLLAKKGANLDELAYNGRPALFEAIWKGRVAVIRMLLAAGASVTVRDHEGHTALFHATAHRDDEILHLLVEAGADVEAPAVYGFTPLQWAAANGMIPLMELLIMKGARLDAQSQDGETALHRAIKERANAAAEFLVANGANVNAEKEDGTRPLELAAITGNVAMTGLLIKKGAIVNAKDRRGRTALHSAASKDNEEIVRILLNNGANMTLRTNFGDLPLSLAVSHGREKAVELLLDKQTTLRTKSQSLEVVLWGAIREGQEGVARVLINRGANIKATPDEGVRALGIAAARGHAAVTSLILEQGVDVNGVCSETGKTALIHAVEEQHDDVVRVLVERGANVREQNDNGPSVLHAAVSKCRWEMVEVMLEHGASLNSLSPFDIQAALRAAATYGHNKLVEMILRDGPRLDSLTDYNCERGYIPLYEALQARHFSIADRLLKAGAPYKGLSTSTLRESLHSVAREGFDALMWMVLTEGVPIDLEKKVDGMTILAEAAKAGHLPIVQMLVGAGAKVNLKVFEPGKGALHWAAENGHEEIVRFLYVEGASNNPCSTDGQTATTLAVANGHTNVVQLLSNPPKRRIKMQLSQEELSARAFAIMPEFSKAQASGEPYYLDDIYASVGGYEHYVAMQQEMSACTVANLANPWNGVGPTSVMSAIANKNTLKLGRKVASSAMKNWMSG